MNGSARGTALVVLLIAVPSLAVAMWFAARGSARAQIVWLGAVGYILYNSVLFLFMSPFNNLFLLYVAMMSLAIWSSVMVIRGSGSSRFTSVSRRSCRCGRLPSICLRSLPSTSSRGCRVWCRAS